jgi:hypothetical protein
VADIRRETDMEINRNPKSAELAAAVCRELLALARHEEDVAAAEASRSPYWAASPLSVVGHRSAARALRADIARLEAEARTWSDAS